ncbi:Bicoid-interacting protein 3-domain-containing protein [Fennellomyces sp. T-0311]|nr:Bicoid-interacting protein 3-domain-containing protein [Fennellomyces sp. T-0311]
MSEQPNPYIPSRKPQPQKRKINQQGPTKSKRTKMLGARVSVPMETEAPPQTQARFNIDQYLYGNYRNYYESRRGNVDPHDGRLDLLDASLFKDKRVLDIGCNSGNITIMIGLQYQAKHVLGIDLDDVLIKKAERQLRLVNSLRNPDGNDALDILMRFMYFPRALATTHGFVPMSVPPNYKSTEFPYNVKFETADWMEMDDPGQPQYDTIEPDEMDPYPPRRRRHQNVLQKVYRVLKPGGSFVVEPQPYETYQRRAKLTDTLMAVFEAIQFKPDQFHDFLMDDVGFTKFTDLGSSGEKLKGFDRPMHVYTK